MIAITTKFLAATNHRPARIKATALNWAHTVSYYDYSSDDAAYMAAARGLCDARGWNHPLFEGGLQFGGRVFVMVPELTIILKELSALGDAVESLNGLPGDYPIYQRNRAILTAATLRAAKLLQTHVMPEVK